MTGTEASAESQASRLERIYSALFEEEEARACSQISEAACRQTPRSFLYHLLSGSASKLAERLAGPRLVLPALLASLGAPVFFAGLLVPLREAGSLLPQMFAGGWVRGFARKRWFWMGPALVQAGCIAGMAAAALSLAEHPILFGTIVSFLVLCFAVASGISSVAYKDVLAKTIAKGARGRLLALRASFGGGLSLAAGAAIAFSFGDAAGPLELVALLVLAAAFWILSVLAFARIPEAPGATDGGKNALAEARAGLQHLREGDFLRFLLARGLLLALPLAIPFASLLAGGGIEAAGADDAGGSAADGAGEARRYDVSGLGLLMVALAFAEICSSPVWGGLADRNARLAMALGGALFAATTTIPLWDHFLSDALRRDWLYPAMFFCLGLAYAGVRLGRKTYIVDAAPAELRSLFVALASTSIGALALVLGGLSALIESLQPGAALLVLGGLGAAGALAALFQKGPAEFCRHLKQDATDQGQGPDS